MTSITSSLKSYQSEAMKRLEQYLELAKCKGPAAAFHDITGRGYIDVQHAEAVPYVCLRVPTGGGKTLMAAATVNIIADSWLLTEVPVILWLVPSDPILIQTLATLRDRKHRNRRALSDRFGERIAVLDIGDALYAKPAVYDGTAVIIVCTMQAFRREITEGRRVYAANGELAEHFSVLDDAVLARLERETPDGRPISSLANVLRARRPGIIMDEAHNSRTELSFETLGRLAPSVIIEYSATPVLPGKASKGQVPSNVLVQVAAAELKAANMVKLPIVLRGRSDPRLNLGDAIAWLRHLNERIDAERILDPSLAPAVMLIQAEPEYEARASIHVGEVKRILKDDFHCADEEIAVSSGARDGLKGNDLSLVTSKIRYVVTQQKLREGWDCPSAYVLCTIAEQRSDRSVEQLLGRVLRLPGAKLKSDVDLNRAYAFATSTDFIATASTLRDGLVDCGFEEIEAEGLISVPENLPGFELGGLDLRHEEQLPPSMDAAAYAERVSSASGGRITIDIERRRLVCFGPVSVADSEAVHQVLPSSARDALRCLVQRGRGARPSAPLKTLAPFRVPRLVVKDGFLEELFDKTHFLNTVWKLDKCSSEPVTRRFKPFNHDGDGAIVDVEETGRVTVEYLNLLQQMPLSIRDTGWTRVALVAWLDRHSIGADRMDIDQGASVVFINRVLNEIASASGLDLPDLAQAKYELRDALRRGVHELREKRSKEAFQQMLLGPGNLNLTTSQSDPALMTADDYSYQAAYTGPVLFQKHAFRMIGDLAPAGEEHDCAVFSIALVTFDAGLGTLLSSQRLSGYRLQVTSSTRTSWLSWKTVGVSWSNTRESLTLPTMTAMRSV